MSATINKAYKFVLETDASLTDLVLVFTAPNGDKITLGADGTTVTAVDEDGTSITAPFTPSYDERGTATGIYDISFTPNTLGDYHVKMTSATNSLNLGGVVPVDDLDLRDLAGANFDPAHDTLHKISDIEDDIANAQNAVGRIFVG